MSPALRLINLERNEASFKEVPFKKHIGVPEKKEFQDLFLLRDDFNIGIFRDYVRFKEDESLKHGAFFLENVFVSDHWGLVRSITTNGIFNLTPGFGWMPDHFAHLISKGHVSETATGDYLLHHDDAPKVTLSGFSALLSFPGALTFGHWIVDIWGRVEILKRLGVFHDLDHFLVPSPVSEWMRSFFAFFEIDANLIRPLSREKNYYCENLVIPTVPSQSSGGIIPASIFGNQFRRRSEYISRWLPTGHDDWSGPLFLRHTPLTSDKNRSLANALDAEAVILSSGGRVVDPVNIPIGELLQLIKQSSIVVGQDSSALHNISFVGKDLIVIETVRRRNMLHVSLQDIANKRVGYLTSNNEHGLWKIDQGHLSNILEQSLLKIQK
ncbi:DUF563 domain-containing protein [Rhodobacterales bacterium LSUCC0031]|nr:DUF563 domain-containing protein [Rhodobacterales bacterium LSUCC0031]